MRKRNETYLQNTRCHNSLICKKINATSSCHPKFGRSKKTLPVFSFEVSNVITVAKRKYGEKDIISKHYTSNIKKHIE
jgi:hypothetical protein